MENIGISGIGTSVGLGILKSIRDYSPNYSVIGIDNQVSAHSFMVNKFIHMDKVENQTSRDHIIKIINDNKIRVVLIASEYEIEWYATHQKEIEDKTEAKIAVAPIKWILLGNDKFKTYKFLHSINLPLKNFFYHDVIQGLWISGKYNTPLEKKDFPAYIKPKKGTSNKGIIYLRSYEELTSYIEKGNNLKDKVIQKSLKNNSESFEVSSSILVNKNGELPFKPFHAKRILNKGISWSIERINSEFLDSYLINTIKAMPNYYGSLNIQFIGSYKDGFSPLEINTRFSGTTSYRLACNRNEVMLVVKDLLNQDTSELIKNSYKYLTPRMFRYVEDFIA